MWHGDGRKLTGYYGTWKGREVELSALAVVNGSHQLIQDGGASPGLGWLQTRHPNRFARSSIRYHLDVDPGEVSDLHSIEAHTYLGTSAVRVLVIAEDRRGRLAVESSTDGAPAFLERIAEEYDLTLDGPTVYGWVWPADTTPLAVHRIDPT